MSEKGTFFSAISPVEAKLAINSIPLSLLLLLLLLACIEHAPFCQRDRFVKHVDVADMVGEHQYERRVEIGAFSFAQAAMRLDDGAEGVVGLCEVRCCREWHRQNLS